MRILLTSDLHYRDRFFHRLHAFAAIIAKENPDVICLAGDHTGDHPDATRMIYQIIRDYYDGPIVSCLGNHDYWAHIPVKNQDDMIKEFELKMRQAVSAAEDYNVHLLEEHGAWSNPEHYGIVILGHGGWYHEQHFDGRDSSNDYAYLPIKYQGTRIAKWLNQRAELAIRGQISTLTDDDWTRIAMTHMPVVDPLITEYRAAGEPKIGELLRHAGCKKFLSGHIHNVRHEGPYRYQAGGDHGVYAYVTLEVI